MNELWMEMPSPKGLVKISNFGHLEYINPTRNRLPNGDLPCGLVGRVPLWCRIETGELGWFVWYASDSMWLFVNRDEAMRLFDGYPTPIDTSEDRKAIQRRERILKCSEALLTCYREAEISGLMATGRCGSGGKAKRRSPGETKTDG